MALVAATVPVALAARAADYRIIASGTFSDASTFSDTFDGTVHGELPPLLDVNPLTGGTFSASFQFSMVTPLDGGTSAFYEIPGELSGMTFELFGSAGQLLQRGNNLGNAIGLLSDNDGGAPYIVDQVLLASDFGGFTETHFPLPLYTPPGEIFMVADLSCFGYVDASTNYLTGLNIPVDAATYMGFPTRLFDVYLSFYDGDPNAVDPYRFAEARISYNITALSVAAVPEPGSAILLASFALVVSGKRRRSRAVAARS